MISNLDGLTEEQKKEMMKVSKSKTKLKTRAKRLKEL